jgi:hypothetical protein
VAFEFKPLARHQWLLSGPHQFQDWILGTPYENGHPPVIVGRNEACIYRAERRDGVTVPGISYRYLVVIKRNRWNHRSLSCGVWFRSPTDDDALERLLDGN